MLTDTNRPCCGPSGPDTRPTSRREFLRRAGGGFGILALASLLDRDGLLAAEPIANEQSPVTNPLAPRPPHFAPRAQCHFPVHVWRTEPHRFIRSETRSDSPCRPADSRSFGTFKTRRNVAKNKLLPPLRPFRKHGQSGIDVSDFLPHIAGCVDDLCVLRGCYGDSVTHPESVYLMNTGSILMGRASLGAWTTYGLGTENQNLPAFVVLPDPGGWVKGGAPAWSNGYLPATYQGTILRGGESPILDLNTPRGVSAEQQRATVDFVNKLNREQLRPGDENSELAARIAAYVGLPHAEPRAGSREPFRRDERRATSTASADKIPGLWHAVCSPAALSKRACVSSRSIAVIRTVGMATPTWKAITQCFAPKATAHRRTVERSQSSRTARLDAGRLGR
jgi:hypothetical protein